jgi:hypothetical protein
MEEIFILYFVKNLIVKRYEIKYNTAISKTFN